MTLEGTSAELVRRLGDLEAAGVERVMLQHLAHDDVATVARVGQDVIALSRRFWKDRQARVGPGGPYGAISS